MDKISISIKVEGQESIELVQTHFNTFTVRCGKSVKAYLDYADAATEFGLVVMDALASSGAIDNRTAAEARKDGDTRPVYDRAAKS